MVCLILRLCCVYVVAMCICFCVSSGWRSANARTKLLQIMLQSTCSGSTGYPAHSAVKCDEVAAPKCRPPLLPLPPSLPLIIAFAPHSLELCRAVFLRFPSRMPADMKSVSMSDYECSVRDSLCAFQGQIPLPTHIPAHTPLHLQSSLATTFQRKWRPNKTGLQ